jgi:hypothetical protein
MSGYEVVGLGFFHLSRCSKRLNPNQSGERPMLQFVTYTQELGN